MATEYAATAVKEFTYFVTQSGNAPSTRLQVVELPDDTVPTAYAPEIAALASREISGARELSPSRQYYRASVVGRISVSPASKNDSWIKDGFARYSEARYVESAAGQAAFDDVIKDMSVVALAYDSVPLSSADKLDYFSPEFQSLVTDKGAMILHMLRYVLGDAKYLRLMRDFATQYAGKPVTTDEFRKLAEKDMARNSPGFSPGGFDQRAHSRSSTPFTASAAIRDFASSAQSRRTSISSECR